MMGYGSQEASGTYLATIDPNTQGISEDSLATVTILKHWNAAVELC